MKKTLTKVFLLSILFISSQASAKTYSKAFAGDFDTVWKGLLISLSKYPLNKNDQESGEIVTSKVKAGEIYKAYNEEPNFKEHYQLFINVEKITIQGRKAIKVKIEKKAYIKGDFINKERALESSGIEESVLLYRTFREVKIDRKVAKLYK